MGRSELSDSRQRRVRSAYLFGIMAPTNPTPQGVDIYLRCLRYSTSRYRCSHSIPSNMARSFLSLLLLVFSAVVAAIDRPDFSIYQARAKQHRHSSGQLVQGEEELRKIILGWYAIPEAKAYEICHQCKGRIDESTGNEISIDGQEKDGIGTVHRTTPADTCGEQPCLVMPAAPLGYNRFHLRYQSGGGEWSPWSKSVNYNVKDVGHLGT